MKTTGMTHIDLVKLQTVDNEQLIQALFDMSVEDYCVYKFNAGVDYAKGMTDNDVIGFDMLVKTKFYWQWWKNEWAKRDAEFLDLYSATGSQAALYDQYMFIHSVYRLFDDELMRKKSVSMVGFTIDEYMRNYQLQEVAK